MATLSGGAIQAGAIRLYDIREPRPGTIGTLRTHQITSPAPGVDNLSQWLRLVPCPLGLDRLVLRARISQRDYELLPTRSGKGAEVNARTTDFLLPWGAERVHLWWVLHDPRWRTFPNETGTVIAQVHEGGAGQPSGTPPNFYVHVRNGTLHFVQANATYPNGRTVFTRPISPGEEVKFALRCRWRDGIHSVPWPTGYLELTVNGVVEWSDEQTVNCWPLAGDPRQPFPVFGVYQPAEEEAWWVGQERTVYHVGAATGDGNETYESLLRFVESGFMGYHS